MRLIWCLLNYLAIFARLVISTVQFIGKNIANGLITRKARHGPEWSLVQDFIGCAITVYTKPRTKLAIFYEPLIDTGFPDLVIAEYNPRAFENWSDARFLLKPADIKVLHHIFRTRGTSSELIQAQLGLESKQLLRIVETLLDAKLIRRYAKEWHAIDINKIFALKKLIAIEAKINNWKSAFRQAQTNKWFASESYILSPTRKPSAKIRQKAEDLDLGIYSCIDSKVEEIRQSPRSALPLCYASWLFNEWIGKSLNKNSKKESNCAYS